MVGVVDDGVDGSHPELRDNYVTIAFLFQSFLLFEALYHFILITTIYLMILDI